MIKTFIVKQGTYDQSIGWIGATLQLWSVNNRHWKKWVFELDMDDLAIRRSERVSRIQDKEPWNKENNEYKETLVDGIERRGLK